MSKNTNILILNTGGTFNKIYDEFNGNLIVPKNNYAVNKILLNSKINKCKVKGLIYKDSLEINVEDRKLLKRYIISSKYKKIIIIHGTDTMDETAKYLDKNIKNKEIILTGAMVPFSVNQIEATSNLMLAYGYLSHKLKAGIYISMHGNIRNYKKIKKNRTLGVFECQK